MAKTYNAYEGEEVSKVRLRRGYSLCEYPYLTAAPYIKTVSSRYQVDKVDS